MSKYKKNSSLGIIGGSICMDLLTADGESFFFTKRAKVAQDEMNCKRLATQLQVRGLSDGACI